MEFKDADTFKRELQYYDDEYVLLLESELQNYATQLIQMHPEKDTTDNNGMGFGHGEKLTNDVYKVIYDSINTDEDKVMKIPMEDDNADLKLEEEELDLKLRLNRLHQMRRARNKLKSKEMNKKSLEGFNYGNETVDFNYNNE